jgi:hypothetical protein
MKSITRRDFSRAGLSLIAVVTLAGISMSAGPANAVIYCKTVGVPKGCVARPVARPVVVAPVARRVVVAPVARPVVYCRTVGVPKGCVVRR